MPCFLTVGHSYAVGLNRRLAHELARVGNRGAARSAAARALRLRRSDPKTWAVFGLAFAPRLLIARVLGGPR